jgi:hypothetical protein
MPSMKSVVSRVPRFDAPFWVLLVTAAIFVGSLGCLGLAAAAQDAAKADAPLVVANDS